MKSLFSCNFVIYTLFSECFISILTIMITETAFIPAVQSLTTASGWVSSRAGEIVCDSALEQTALLAKEQLSRAGLSCTVHLSNDFQCSQGSLCIRLQKDAYVEHEEGYELSINDQGVLIKARTEAGLYYGIQSLRQLVYSCDGRYPYLTIKDYPSFSWRGIMIDTSRTFYPVDFLKKMIDAASFHKLNRFHWHLTDDQGWRLPVDGYEKLTEKGAYRKDPRYSWGEKTGGYYTKADITSVVAYAAQHHMMVVPEIETPGHASAILASYPELGCTGGPYEVEYRYGIFDEVLCAGNDDVFTMLGKVFDTVCELFPSPYVHIGGDECPRTRWKSCPKCQDRMKKENLSSEDELQSWITVKVSKMLEERGKIAVGWDEVLDGTERLGLPKSLVVQSWRGMEGGKRASALGHKVIMSPQTAGCYLDHKPYDDPSEPGMHKIATVKDSYSYSPVTDDMSREQSSCVLGGQGNLWTEVVYASKIAEYMIFPRLCAISESLWLEKDKKDFVSFAKRLFTHKKRLDAMNILYYRGKLD